MLRTFKGTVNKMFTKFQTIQYIEKNVSLIYICCFLRLSVFYYHLFRLLQQELLKDETLKCIFLNSNSVNLPGVSHMDMNPTSTVPGRSSPRSPSNSLIVAKAFVAEGNVIAAALARSTGFKGQQDNINNSLRCQDISTYIPGIQRDLTSKMITRN